MLFEDQSNECKKECMEMLWIKIKNKIQQEKQKMFMFGYCLIS